MISPRFAMRRRESWPATAGCRAGFCRKPSIPPRPCDIGVFLEFW